MSSRGLALCWVAVAAGFAAMVSCGSDNSGGGGGVGGTSPDASAGASGTGGQSNGGTAGASGTAGKGGQAGSTTGGSAGNPSGGSAGTSTGGSAGSQSGGAAGASEGGSAGSSGAANGGSAGAETGGTAGNAGSAGNAGNAGTAGGETGGSAGNAGSAGTAGTAGNAGSAGSAGAGGSGQSAMPSNSKIIYLHHSTGGVIWDGGVAGSVTSYNTAHSTQYQITSQDFPKSSPYGWNNYPYDYWNIWVNHAGAQAYMTEPTLEILTQQYQVIVFKHCFPVSGVEADTGSPDIASQTKSQENYKLQYAALKQKLRQYPSNRFIVWTGAALREADTSSAQATRAKAFFDWVKGTWDEPGDNIYVWDFWTLETGGGLYLLPANATGDSHPNSTFAQTAAPLFVARLTDVIEGRGDTGSLTGQ